MVRDMSLMLSGFAAGKSVLFEGAQLLDIDHGT